MNKELKKGFWSKLFGPKKKRRCCSSDIVIDKDTRPTQPCTCTPASSDSLVACSSPINQNEKVSEVIVLGPGCAKCKETYRIVMRVIAENGLNIRLSKIEDIAEMLKYNILTTPVVIVDQTVKIKGHIPTVDEVKKALGI